MHQYLVQLGIYYNFLSQCNHRVFVCCKRNHQFTQSTLVWVLYLVVSSAGLDEIVEVAAPDFLEVIGVLDQCHTKPTSYSQEGQEAALLWTAQDVSCLAFYVLPPDLLLPHVELGMLLPATFSLFVDSHYNLSP